MKRKPKQTLWKFFLHHYLFFRIPLVAPDAFLRRTHSCAGRFLGLSASFSQRPFSGPH